MTRIISWKSLNLSNRDFLKKKYWTIKNLRFFVLWLLLHFFWYDLTEPSFWFLRLSEIHHSPKIKNKKKLLVLLNMKWRQQLFWGLLRQGQSKFMRNSARAHLNCLFMAQSWQNWQKKIFYVRSHGSSVWRGCRPAYSIRSCCQSNRCLWTWSLRTGRSINFWCYFSLWL